MSIKFGYGAGGFGDTGFGTGWWEYTGTTAINGLPNSSYEKVTGGSGNTFSYSGSLRITFNAHSYTRKLTPTAGGRKYYEWKREIHKVYFIKGIRRKPFIISKKVIGLKLIKIVAKYLMISRLMFRIQSDIKTIGSLYSKIISRFKTKAVSKHSSYNDLHILGCCKNKLDTAINIDGNKKIETNNDFNIDGILSSVIKNETKVYGNKTIKHNDNILINGRKDFSKIYAVLFNDID
jgi:hypothetical protein